MAAIQAIDATTLRALLAELRSALLPSRFEKAQQADPHTLQLALRSLEGVRWIEISWLAEAPRLHAISAPPRQGEGSTLALQLQHSLRGLALVALMQQGWERVVELVFARRPGEPAQRILVLELMGRHSNLFLLDEQRRVIAAARQVRASQSRLRPIGTGDPYSPPPPLQGEPPRLAESQADWIRRLTLQPLPLGEALRRSYQGISPALVQQLLEDLPALGTSDPATLAVATLASGQWASLHARWRQWLGAVEQERFQFQRAASTAYRCWQPSSESALVSPGGTSPATEAGLLPLNAGLAAYYGECLGDRSFRQARSALQQRLEAALVRERRELQRQEDLLALVPAHEVLQRRADALLCQPDPPRQRIEEAQKLYHQARRLRRSVAAITPRIAWHRNRQTWLETSLHFLERCDQADAIAELAQECEELLSPRQGSRRPARQGGRPTPLELHTPRGLRLQVGRNHRQNDWISLRQARRGDLWFHAQECPGSHVVLKASEAAAEAGDLAAAADLAAHFSRARGNRRVPVVMVAAETLQRIPGEPPGTVRHGAAEVLWGEPARALPMLQSPTSAGADPLPPLAASPSACSDGSEAAQCDT